MFTKCSMNWLKGSENYMVHVEILILRREQMSKKSKCFMILILKASLCYSFLPIQYEGRLGGCRSLLRLAVVSQRQKDLHFPWKQSEEFPKQGNCLNYATYFSLPVSPFWLKWFMIFVSSYPTLPSGPIGFSLK